MEIINLRNIILLIIMIGIILMVFQYAQMIKKCDEPKILYKYIPRNLAIDDTIPDNVSYIFKDMFTETQPYIIDIGMTNNRT